MKKHLLLLLLLPLTLSAQQLFQKELYSRALISLTDITLLPDKGYLACGYAQPADNDSSLSVVLRMDSTMNVLWCKNYNMLRKDYFRTITRLSDGNFIIGGTTRADFSTYYGANMYKIDIDGHVIWHKLYDNVYDDVTLGVFEQADKSLVNIIRYGVSGRPTKIIHTNSSGEILTQIMISAPEYNQGPLPDYVVSDGSGNFYICGSTRNTTTNNFVVYILKADTTSVTWYKEYDFDGLSASATGLIRQNNGDLVVSGSIVDSVATNATHIVVMKVNPSSGDPVWTKEIQQEPVQTQSAFGIASVAGNNILLSGRILNYVDIRSFGMKLNNDGDIVWGKGYGDGPFAMISFTKEIPGNRYLFTGKKTNDAGPYFILTDTAGNPSCDSYPVDFVSRDLTVTTYTSDLAVTDIGLKAISPAFTGSNLSVDVNTICTGAVSVKNPSRNNDISIFPNPATRQISIKLPDDFEPAAVLSLYTIQGKKVLTKVLVSPLTKIELDLIPGIYFVEIQNVANSVLRREKLMIN